MSKKIVVGVWKDKLSYKDSLSMATNLLKKCDGLNVSGFIASVAPAPYAAAATNELLKGSPISVTYQDVHWAADTGSYMGSTPIRLLSEVSIKTCMVGHSERRRFFGETSDDRFRKITGLLNAGILPILCIGDNVEDWTERREILRSQLSEDLGTASDRPIDPNSIIIAYEPVWAISTWRSDMPLPTGEDVGRMLKLVREVAQEVSGRDCSDSSVLFGGSVGPTNAEEYFSTPGVDGALVGAASLNPDSMYQVFKAASNAWSI